MNVGRPPTQMLGCYIFMRRAQDGVANNNAGDCGRCILADECQAGPAARALATSRIRFPRRFAQLSVVRGGQHMRSVNIARIEIKKVGRRGSFQP